MYVWCPKYVVNYIDRNLIYKLYLKSLVVSRTEHCKERKYLVFLSEM
jgi:hypothetical protein